MTNNTIKHLGIVENIQGSHLSVRIVQTSACAACSAKGHCSSADSKDKIIDITDVTAASYQVGERVMVIGETSMGMMAVVLAFVLPLVLFYVWKVTNTRFIFRETMSHVEVLAHPFGECRESQIPQVFGLRRKSANPL